VQGAGAWHSPLPISPIGLAPPGAGLAASNQFGLPNQTDVFVADKAGILKVVWVQSAGTWKAPLAMSGAGVVLPGSELAASQQFGLDQTDVFVNAEATVVFWVHGAGTWNSLQISPAGVPTAGAGLAASNQFGVPNQTDVFVVSKAGALNVLWVQIAGTWHGPLPI
jgi:uncharacterized membrane protein YccF (DUF307 family)